MYLPNVFIITATCGRMSCLKRALAVFLDQDYEGEHTMLIFNNSEVPLQMELPLITANKHVLLVNNHLSTTTKQPYGSLGEIYNDVLNFIPYTAEVIVHGDDDDIYLPNHITEGVKGLDRCGKTAYKPKFSWFLHPGGCDLMENTMEPSIFIEANFLKAHGYTEGKSVSQHLKWVHALQTIEQICSDPDGLPTLLYTWGIDPIYKTSGAGETPENFLNYRAASQDFGDRVLVPAHRDTYIELLNQAHARSVQHSDHH